MRAEIYAIETELQHLLKNPMRFPYEFLVKETTGHARLVGHQYQHIPRCSESSKRMANTCNRANVLDAGEVIHILNNGAVPVKKDRRPLLPTRHQPFHSLAPW